MTENNPIITIGDQTKETSPKAPKERTLSRRLDGIGEYYFSQKLREIDQLNRQGKNIISLGVGSPDLPPHPEVIRVLQEESAKPNTHAYQSYKGSPVLRQAMSEWYRKWYQVELDPEREILPLIGSKEGIMHICMTYLDEGDYVLVPDPGYPTYQSASKLGGGKTIPYLLKEENGWFPDFDALESIVSETGSRTKLMFVNYPHMPTGQLPDEGLFDRLIDFAGRHGILLVHDNPYSFILNSHPASILSRPGSKEVALELNSLSKSQNMAGWRVGMLAGASEKIDAVMRFKSNMDSGMFLPLQLAAAHALRLPAEWYQDLNAIYTSRRAYVYRILELLTCSFDRRQAGMFVWARVPSGKDGYALSDELLASARVFITPGGIFGQEGIPYVRLSLCCPEEKLEQALARINEYIEQTKATNV
jgi:aspartate/methionine/tyrosine aminotransferase